MNRPNLRSRFARAAGVAIGFLVVMLILSAFLEFSWAPAFMRRLC